MRANTLPATSARLMVGLVALAAMLSGCAGPQADAQPDRQNVLGTGKPALAGPALPQRLEKQVQLQAAMRHETACCSRAWQLTMQRALIRTAARFVGTRRIEARGRRFTYDCSGLARAVYFSQGVDLFDGVTAHGRTNGVRLIREYLVKHGRLYSGPTARPGDLVFFHNTWDANRDGQVNDPWTHVGIVETVEANGTVVFISRVSRGVERYRLNLKRPRIHRATDGPVLNDFMRKKRWRDTRQTRYLTGELFATFGTLTH